MTLEIMRRDEKRFPLIFCFSLQPIGQGKHRKYAPLVFTEHGAIMAAPFE